MALLSYEFKYLIDQTSAHHWYTYRSRLRLNNNMFCGEQKYDFHNSRMIFLSLQNELSDVNEIYIDISNWQKFISGPWDHGFLRT